jgi:pimeloyl-ACP methyl ester carboxylesterase
VTGRAGGSRGSPLFLRRLGRGDALLLVHGLMATGEMFEPAAEALAGRHTVVIPDLRGQGRSAHLEGICTVEGHARDLAGLLDHLGIGRTDVLGYSQGGAVAQRFAHDHPERVRRLVLVNTFAHNGLTARERLENRAGLWLLRLLGPRALTRIAASPKAGGGRPLSPEQAQCLRKMMASGDKGRTVEAMRAMIRFDSRPWLAEISCPTLVIHGSEDTAVPRPHAEMLARGIPGARLAEIEGAGHALLWTHPERLVEEVERWLSEQEMSAARRLSCDALRTNNVREGSSEP